MLLTTTHSQSWQVPTQERFHWSLKCSRGGAVAGVAMDRCGSCWINSGDFQPWMVNDGWWSFMMVDDSMMVDHGDEWCLLMDDDPLVNKPGEITSASQGRYIRGTGCTTWTGMTAQLPPRETQPAPSISACLACLAWEPTENNAWHLSHDQGNPSS